MPNLYIDCITLPGSPLEGENPLPLFRTRPHDTEVLFEPSLPDELKRHFGENTSRRVLPYSIQDRYTRSKRPTELRLIVLENDKLKASFTPELGGRLWSLVQKETGRELLSRNSVFQPANLAIRNAWFSGGIEWNFGYVGHACHTCSPVFAAKIVAEGETFLRLYEFERMTRMFWQIDFHLPDGSDALYAHVKILNPNQADIHTYWWTNIAVPETEHVRVFAPADDVIYIRPKAVGQRPAYGLASMPVLPSLPGKDFSYPTASDFANEYFFQCPEAPSYWEAVVYENGDMFFDRSTHPLRFRKMFCWGQHSGGRHWQEFLSEPDTAYLEIQAGLAPTQMHGLTMPAGAVWEWTQLFTGGTVDAAIAHQSDWKTARAAVERTVSQIASDDKLLAYDRVYSRLASAQITEIMQSGAGWGALEIHRMRQAGEELPQGLSFGDETIGHLQQPWLRLLQEGVLPVDDPSRIPPAWMTQPEWYALLMESLSVPGGHNWLSLLHAGNMLYEADDEDKAIDCWKQSAALAPSIVVFRNLSLAADRKGNEQEAVDWMGKAWKLPGSTGDPALAEEYIDLMNRTNRLKEAWTAYEQLPENVKSAERVQLLVAKAGMVLGKLEFIQGLFTREYSVIREGETILTDLWFQLHAKQLAKERGIEVNDELLQEAMVCFPPPSNIDFRPLGY